MKPTILFVLLMACSIIPSATAYLVNYSVSPIANAQITNTAASTVVGANISWLNMTTNRGATPTISLTGTTLVVGATKVATVGLKTYNVSNISTMNRVWIDFPIQLPANATVTNASLILYLSSKTTTFGAPDLIVTNASPADPTNGVLADYHKFLNISGMPIYNQTPVTFQSWTAATRKVIYLNEAGRAAIEAARNYKTPGGNENNFVIGLRSEWDVTRNNRTMIWTQLTAQSAIYTLGSMQSVIHAQDPFLNITYSMPDQLTLPPPVANFTANLTPAYNLTPIRFFDQSNNTVPATTTYYWNFIDGGKEVNSTERDPIFTYEREGDYQINHTVSVGEVVSNSYSPQVIIIAPYVGGGGAPSSCYPNIIPQFSANLTVGEIPLVVQFFDTTKSLTTDWAWNVSDGGNRVDSNDQHPVFTFTTAGTYTVNFTATNVSANPEANSTIITNYITALPAATPSPTPTPCPPGSWCYWDNPYPTPTPNPDECPVGQWCPI